MSVNSEFLDYIYDLLRPLGPLNQRRMFGGHCLYRGGIPFAVVFDDTLYFKVDDSNREDFQSHGIHDSIRAFEKDKSMTISYYEVPADIMEDRDALCTWARKAFEVAVRSRQGKTGDNKGQKMAAKRK